jgi:hypothetical protein
VVPGFGSRGSTPLRRSSSTSRGVAMAVPFQRLRAACTPSTQGRRYSSRSLAMDGHPRAPEIHSITDS